jgi:signal transduction histidine kinase
MKAATAISGETALVSLLEKLIRIAIENAGAQKGFLILKKDNQLFIEAQGSVNTEEQVLIRSIDIRNTSILPEPIVNFVNITKETLVLSDALNDKSFANNEVVKQHGIRSLLCMPLLHKGDIVCLLYFENNLITNAFTPERVEILKLLSGQMAVSLQNALNEEKKMNVLMEKENLLAQIHLHEQVLLKTKLEIQEQTLYNISNEIHDNLGQSLSFIKLKLNSIHAHNADKSKDIIAESVALLTKVIQDLRDLAKTLNTDFITSAGLVSAITQQLDFLKKTGAYYTELTVTGEEIKCQPHHELVLFRIVQELLNNIIKHAAADRILVRIQYQAEGLVIVVQDNGKGFSLHPHQPVHRDGLGLSNVRSRIRLINGTIEFESSQGKGTRIIIQLPR